MRQIHAGRSATAPRKQPRRDLRKIPGIGTENHSERYHAEDDESYRAKDELNY